MVVVANGEIYNFRELADLERRGHRYATRSVSKPSFTCTKNSIAGLQYLRGMFFALYDADEIGSSTRDRLGISALLLAERRQVLFASEIRPCSTQRRVK